MGAATVYEWDNNCQRIHDRLINDLNSILRELNELKDTSPGNTGDLLNYFKKWHYNNGLFLKTREEVSSRKRVMETLLKRGYGVSIDLTKDMESFQKNEIQTCQSLLKETFDKHYDFLKNEIYLPQDQKANRNSQYIIRELSKKLGDESDSLPFMEQTALKKPIDAFLNTVQDTPPYAHVTILNRMFLEFTEESGTIMEGTIGETDVDSPQYLKLVASKNIRELFTYLYDTIDQDIQIDIDWIKKIHFSLTKGLDSSHTWKAGEFRTEDFIDKSGLTFEFGNFQKGLDELKEFLENADWKTESLQKFNVCLSRLYYMLLGIHPFLDSNGRTSKCLINHLMLRRGLPPLIFDMNSEVMFLPRYGGSLINMQNHFWIRISASIDRYFFEREKIRHHNNLEKFFFRTDFDAGFYFRHLNGLFPLIEFDFKIYIMQETHPLYQHYIDKCRIVLPDESLIGDLMVYYGFTIKDNPQWREQGQLNLNQTWHMGFDSNCISYYSTNCFIQAGAHLAKFDTLEISLACPEKGLIFNNKSLNYRYNMDKNHLLKMLGDSIINGINSGPSEAEISNIKRIALALEHRARDIIRDYNIDESFDLRERRDHILFENPDLSDAYKTMFIPHLFYLIQKHNLTERRDPHDPDNSFLILHCAQGLTPLAVKLLGYI